MGPQVDGTGALQAVILSDALDTNGQNARYAKASTKFGTDPGVLKALALGNTDPAGVMARFAMAAEKFGELRIRAAHKLPYEYMQFPVDMVWDRKTEPEIYQLALEADVIHLNNSERAAIRWQLRKPFLLHHHGTLFRSNPDRMFQVATRFRMVQAVSTIDLLQPNPDILHWLPSAYDVDGLLAFGEANRREPDGRVRIGHFATNQGTKHTQVFIAVVRELIEEGLPIDVVPGEWIDPDLPKDWIPKWTHARVMEEKARCDIVFDQLAYGYGCNSIEAWSMGIPVVSGADDWTLARMRQEWSNRLPFYQATEKTLKRVLRRLVQSSQLRADWAAKGMAHVRKYHDERPALAKLAELYSLAISGYVKRRIPMKDVPPVTFLNPGKRNLYLEGERLPFADGSLTTADPFVIQYVRQTIAVHPLWGIREQVPEAEDVA